MSQGKKRSVWEIDWIEIKSITQMLSHCKPFTKDPAEWSWNEMAFYKYSPNSSPFYYFSLMRFLFCVLQVSIKAFPICNNALLQGSLTESGYHLCRQLETSLITIVLQQSGSRLITDIAKKSSSVGHAVPLSCPVFISCGVEAVYSCSCVEV